MEYEGLNIALEKTINGTMSTLYKQFNEGIIWNKKKKTEEVFL